MVGCLIANWRYLAYDNNLIIYFLYEVLEVTKGWIAIGFIGQAMFSARFLVQWLASERAGRSVVPMAFWVLSILGAMTLLAYAIWRRDPVFIVGQSTGIFIYLRNVHLVRRERAAAAAGAGDIL